MNQKTAPFHKEFLSSLRRFDFLWFETTFEEKQMLADAIELFDKVGQDRFLCHKLTHLSRTYKYESTDICDTLLAKIAEVINGQLPPESANLCDLSDIMRSRYDCDPDDEEYPNDDAELRIEWVLSLIHTDPRKRELRYVEVEQAF